MYMYIHVHVHVCDTTWVYMYMCTCIHTHNNLRWKERKKDRHLGNEKMSCLRWDLNPRHSALRTDALNN